LTESISEITIGGESYHVVTNFMNIYSLGRNNVGQLGDNTITDKSSATLIGGFKPSRWVSISGNRGARILALDNLGDLWGWGMNDRGQIGDNSTTSRRTPVSVYTALSGQLEYFSAGVGHSLGLRSGQVFSWGNNTGGELGDNTITQRTTPVAISGGTKTFCSISAGSAYSMAIDLRGRVWGWGFNSTGQIGNNSVTSTRTPVSILGANKTFCKIHAGDGNTMAIDLRGRLWGWGANNCGKLGNNGTTQFNTPISVLGAVKTFCQIFAGVDHTLAIDKNGRAWAWGNDLYGILGINRQPNTVAPTVCRLTPVSVGGATKTFCKIVANSTYNSLALDKNGGVWGWGWNRYGELGPVLTFTPNSVCGAVKTFCNISVGDQNSAAIDKNGKIWVWGYSTAARTGNAQRDSNIVTPVTIGGANKTFCKIAQYGAHSIAIDKNGRAWGWGQQTTGAIGDTTVSERCTPVSVLGGIKTFCHISVGTQFTLALTNGGRAWAWGVNSQGRLGNNSTTSVRTPVSVLGATKTFCRISAGGTFSIAIDKNGRLWSWGNNTVSGSLGINSASGLQSRLTPVTVLGAVKTFCNVSSGFEHNLAIDKNGRLWGWGNNAGGRLGDNSTTNRLTPVSILGAVKTFCEIKAGNNSSAAIDKNGRLWAWGSNLSGQLGIGSYNSSITPVSVLGANKTFCKIISGFSDVFMAVDKNGRLWAWGDPKDNQIGNNRRIYTPISVTIL
jgi:alpha-tubulin suppressor-like RCC1 family protein